MLCFSPSVLPCLMDACKHRMPGINYCLWDNVIGCTNTWNGKAVQNTKCKSVANLPIYFRLKPNNSQQKEILTLTDNDPINLRIPIANRSVLFIFFFWGCGIAAKFWSVLRTHLMPNSLIVLILANSPAVVSCTSMKSILISQHMG